MSEGTNQPQRYCTNCGAEIRSDIRFCVSCGTSLVRESEESDQIRAEATSADALNEARPRTRGYGYSRGSATPRADAKAILGKATEWFRDLPSVPKLILVGLIVLLLLTVLSPLALVLAALLLVVSVIALIIRVMQGRPISGWAVAVVASIASFLIFGGISGALYGTGFGGGSEPDWATPNNGNTNPLLNASPSSSSVPYYEIASTDLYKVGISTLFVTVKTDATSRTDLEKITKDIGQQADEGYSGKYDFLNMRLCSPDQFGVAGEPEDKCNKSTAAGRVSLTADGEAASGLQKGTYEVSLSGDSGCNEGQRVYADEEGQLHLCEENSPASPSASPTASASPSASDTMPTDEDNADILLITMQAGMVNGHQAIRDVNVSGNKATVIVSGVSDEFAESACRFALDAAPELMMESESNDYTGITEVSVKRPLRLWSAATCSR